MPSTSKAARGLTFAGLLLVSAAAAAQDNTLGNVDATNTVPTTDPTLNDPLATTDPMLADNTMTTAPVQEEDDDDFPWGLLGLLGLAGLIPRKRKDGDINVDARRDR